ncbi:gamma-glutamyl-gamma-aminobutyrate hydrolase family protein [Streptomyces abikoensis]
MTRPVIGIAAYRDRARWDIWDTQATLIQQSYVRGVTEAGGRAVVLPPDDTDDGVLDRLDGLLLPGGADIDPARYGQPRHPRTDDPSTDRDAGELLLLRGALERDLPVLGVCRGLQLLALAYGGSLHQHLPDVLGHGRHLPASGVFGDQRVSLAEGSLAASAIGPEATVRCHHHQGVADPGTLRVTARAADGLPEAVEDPSRRFVLGVQWHPEVMGQHALFAAFVAACAAPAAPGGRLPAAAGR